MRTSATFVWVIAIVSFSIPFLASADNWGADSSASVPSDSNESPIGGAIQSVNTDSSGNDSPIGGAIQSVNTDSSSASNESPVGGAIQSVNARSSNESPIGGAIQSVNANSGMGTVGAPTSATNMGNVGTPNSSPNTRLINPLKSGTSLESFLMGILAFVIRVGTVVVILMLVFVGYKFVAAQGEPGEIAKARQALLYTVIGALILLGAQVIASGILATVKSLGG